MRNSLGTLLNKGLQGIILRTVLIHSNIHGSNSKTTFFELLRSTFPNRTVACNNALLYSNSNESSGGHTEHLMGLNGKSFAYFSEPEEGKSMNSAFLREISGGDIITGSEKHKHNESFKSKALQNILCNGIPSLDTTAKVALDRIRVFPWLARFTHNKDLVNEAKNIYLIEETITDKIEEWYESMILCVTVGRVSTARLLGMCGNHG
jgi:putative DNA primase/helicase